LNRGLVRLPHEGVTRQAVLDGQLAIGGNLSFSDIAGFNSIFNNYDTVRKSTATVTASINTQFTVDGSGGARRIPAPNSSSATTAAPPRTTTRRP